MNLLLGGIGLAVLHIEPSANPTWLWVLAAVFLVTGLLSFAYRRLPFLVRSIIFVLP